MWAGVNYRPPVTHKAGERCWWVGFNFPGSVWQRNTSTGVCCAFPFPAPAAGAECGGERVSARANGNQTHFPHCFSSSLHQDGSTSPAEFYNLSEQIMVSPPLLYYVSQTAARRNVALRCGLCQTGSFPFICFFFVPSVGNTILGKEARHISIVTTQSQSQCSLGRLFFLFIYLLFLYKGQPLHSWHSALK